MILQGEWDFYVAASLEEEPNNIFVKNKKKSGGKILLSST